MTEDISEEIAAVQVWFRHFGCDWSSTKIQKWLQSQGASSQHALSKEQLQALASLLRRTWEGMPKEKQFILLRLSRYMTHFDLTWRSERIVKWMQKRGHNGRDDLGWQDLMDLGDALQTAYYKLNPEEIKNHA